MWIFILTSAIFSMNEGALDPTSVLFSLESFFVRLLNRALNLQERFRIFQKRQVFLWNFPLIKRNSINEIKKEGGILILI
uniref:Ribosomal protein S16 n=1 Tax=Angelica tsinlingensis TaxID=357858 RepID=A0A2L1K197_9APIA|nr:ribosomal protein S16 [Angelica tsinlingensis]